MIAVKNILVATDFGSASEAAFEYGVGLAGNLGSTLHVVHVVSKTAGDGIDGRAVEKLKAAVKELGPILVKTIVLRSAQPAAALLEYARAEQVDLILAGVHGHAGFLDILDFFMGSVAQNLVRNATCPVMTMRGPVAAAA